MTVAGWTTVEDLRARVRRRWADQTLLRAYAAGEAFPEIAVLLRGPRAGDVADRLDAVRSWVAALDAGRHDDRHYALDWTTIGGRGSGRNRVPARARVSTFAQAWSLLGVGPEVRRFDEQLRAAANEPTVAAWARARPLRALTLHDKWTPLLAAYRWLEDHRGSGRYLREITAPGVDTKLAERHRGVLAELLGVPSTGPAFLTGLGLAQRPHLVRLRPDPSLGLLGPIGEASEIAVRHDELGRLRVRVEQAVVVENEVTYLSVPVPAGGVVVWGRGFDVDRAGALPWLQQATVTYWGDLDTHGFAILDRLRAWLPHTRSVLMDRGTLLAHRERWGTEPAPTAARLSRLDRVETQLYDDLVEDRLGPRVRLEQERIDWAWALDRLTRAPDPA